MNEIKVKINFTTQECKMDTGGVNLISGDYNSTKMLFEFDREDGIKVLEIRPEYSNTPIYVGEIINNEVILVGENEGNICSLFHESGSYIFKVSLYTGNSKLTSISKTLEVLKEQVIVDGEEIETWKITVFDQIMNQFTEAMNEVDNLDLDVNKVNHTATVDITKKDGTTKSVEILDGEKGEKGDCYFATFAIENGLLIMEKPDDMTQIDFSLNSNGYLEVEVMI